VDSLPRRLISVQEENSEIVELLDLIGDWNFNTINLNQASNRAPVKEMGNYIFSTLGLVGRFKIDH
jgi:hypothetical protein